MFGRLNTKNADNRIFTSGQGKYTVDSAIYPATITSFTMHEGEGQSIKGILELELELPDGNTRKYTQDLLLMNKEGKNTYIDSKTGKAYNFGDLSIISEICNITLKKYLEDLESSPTMIEVYDFDTKAKKPIQAETITELQGQKIKVAILEYEEYKRVLVGNKWEDSDEVRVKNKIDNIFQYESNKTLKELMAKSPTTVAYDTWNEYWSGKVKEAPAKKGGSKKAKPSASSSNIPESAEAPASGFKF